MFFGTNWVKCVLSRFPKSWTCASYVFCQLQDHHWPPKNIEHRDWASAAVVGKGKSQDPDRFPEVVEPGSFKLAGDMTTLISSLWWMVKEDLHNTCIFFGLKKKVIIQKMSIFVHLDGDSCLWHWKLLLQYCLSWSLCSTIRALDKFFALVAPVHLKHPLEDK